jgi:hypothetical protein
MGSGFFIAASLCGSAPTKRVTKAFQASLETCAGQRAGGDAVGATRGVGVVAGVTASAERQRTDCSRRTGIIGCARAQWYRD